MYYICKFSESWSLYNASSRSTRPLTPIEITTVKELFQELLISNKILSAIQINSINPNKLVGLENGSTLTNGKPKKQP